MTHKADKRLTELSARLDKNHAALTTKLDQLYQLREQASGAQRQEYEAKIRELKEMEIRLLKSKNAAWMAHWLKSDGEVEVVERPHRKLGLALMVFSGVSLILLALYAWSLYG
ncbi:hypothetical protein [Gilvimarinus algae]|uniref:Uncharacterized protein n=1 Tax=Gilvimarinus algae TaxID=3058037 RepID=A0ABT8TJ04_9GAMM|nr:hypothetical protein [Gilvimarinus sp. SDUM040014]MDO3384078.1 hypothetical protein [Gilvimarinus sp. SDUM040014]